MCKEWQRTPQQLLTEHTQGVKRPNARFHPVSCSEVDAFRARCILPDGKKTEKDLSFCPTASADTLDIAKHMAALLALHHMDASRPHERRLPDPFREMWLTMIHGEKGAEVLQGDRKCVSAADQKQQKMKATAKRNEKTRNRENHARANPYPSVWMSAASRKKVETLLAQVDDSFKSIKEEDENEENEKAFVENEKVVKRLLDMGFNKSQVKQAIKHTTASLEEEEMQMTNALDWLCLHVAEEDLPR